MKLRSSNYGNNKTTVIVCNLLKRYETLDINDLFVYEIILQCDFHQDGQRKYGIVIVAKMACRRKGQLFRKNLENLFEVSWYELLLKYILRVSRIFSILFLGLRCRGIGVSGYNIIKSTISHAKLKSSGKD